MQNTDYGGTEQNKNLMWTLGGAAFNAVITPSLKFVLDKQKISFLQAPQGKWMLYVMQWGFSCESSLSIHFKKKLPEGSFPKIVLQPRIQIRAKTLPEWDSVIRASEVISILLSPYARREKLVGWKDFKTWNAKEKLYHNGTQKILKA